MVVPQDKKAAPAAEAPKAQTVPTVPEGPATNQQEADERWDSKVYSAGLDKVDDLLDPVSKDTMQGLLEGTDDQAEGKARMINLAYAQRHTQMDPDQLSDNWDQYRDNFASAVAERPMHGVNDKQLYAEIGKSIAKRQGEESMIGDAVGQMLMKGVEGSNSYIDSFLQVHPAMLKDPNYDSKHEDQYLMALKGAYQRLGPMMTKVQPVAQMITDRFLRTAERDTLMNHESPGNLQAEMQTSSPIPYQAGQASEDLDEKDIEALKSLNPEERRLAISAATMKFQKAKPQEIQSGRMKESGNEEMLSQGATDLITGSAKTAMKLGSLYSQGSAGQIPQGDIDTDEDQISRNLNEAYQKGSLPETGRYGQAWYGFVKNTPMLAAMLMDPVLGTSLTVGQMADDATGEYREGGMKPNEAFAAGLVASAPAALVAKLQEGILSGETMPWMRRFLFPSAKTLPGLAGKTLGHLAIANLTILNVGEAMNEAAKPAIQAAIHALDKAAPEVDWKDKLAEIRDNRFDTFLTLLPLAIIGTGMGTLREGAYMRAYIGRREFMKSVGFTGEQMDGIMKAKTADEATELIKAAWKSPQRQEAATGGPALNGMFDSPNEEEDLTFEQAVDNLQSPEQKEFRDYIKAQAPKGVEIRHAVGDWQDGAENSVAVLSKKPIDADELRLLAAKVGIQGNQKSVLHFVADQNGPSRLYDIRWGKADLTDTRDLLTRVGLKFRTLIPDKGGGVRALVYDHHNDLAPSVAQLLTEENKPSITRSRVRGEFLGDDARVKAQQLFRQIVGGPGEQGSGERGDGAAVGNPPGKQSPVNPELAKVLEAREAAVDRLDKAHEQAYGKIFQEGGATIQAPEETADAVRGTQVAAQLIADHNDQPPLFHVEQSAEPAEGSQEGQPAEWALNLDLDRIEPGKAPGIAEKIGQAMDEAKKTRAVAGIPEELTDWFKDSGRMIANAWREAGNNPQMSDFKEVVNGLVGAMQRNVIATRRLTMKVREVVPDREDREGITNWIQANGDMQVLRDRLAATSKSSLKRGYEAALKLDPNQIKVAQGIQKFYADKLAELKKEGLVENAAENYVNQVWKRDFVGGGSNAQFSGKLQRNFKFGKERTFGSFFEGEQADFTPITKDISSLMGIYLSEANKVLATRQFLKGLTQLKAPDSMPDMARPYLAPFGGGTISQSEDEGPSFIRPLQRSEGTADYKLIASASLRGWKWLGQDSNENAVMMEGQLAVHPEAYPYLNALLGRDKLNEWYNTPGSAMGALGKGLIKALDVGSGEVKGMMFSLSGYHQTQETMRALGERVNPFSDLPELDDKNPLVKRSTDAGLMIATDHGGLKDFMEGYGSRNPFQKIPLVGKLSQDYTDWFFTNYLPRLKQKTWETVVERNTDRFQPELKSGEVDQKAVDYLSAQQVNATYGHLNYVDLGRDPTIKHLMRITMLAPDFLESSARTVGQAGKALLGNKSGSEQLQAIAFLAATQYLTARVMNQALTGDTHKEEPFGIVAGGRVYSMRTVPGDLFDMVSRPRQFASGRVSPLISSAWEVGSGKNYRGEQIGITDSMRDIATNVLPMSLRPFLGSAGKGASNVPLWDQFITANGLRISRNSDINNAFHLGQQYARANAPQGQKPDSTVYPVSDWQQMRYALEDGDMAKAQAELEAVEGARGGKKASAGSVIGAFKESLFRPWTGSKKMDPAFMESLSGSDKARLNKAIEARAQVWSNFMKLNLGKETNEPANH